MNKNQDITEKTLEYWENEVNCARSTVCGILSHNGENSLCDPFYKAMLPMGGGFGEGLVCGAVTGSLAGLSLVLATKGLNDDTIKEKREIWKNVFKEKFDTLSCFELMDEFRNELGEIDFEMAGRREKCTDTVISGVTIAQKIINSV
jgi:hypothetical protein